jgi:hypothetical protein
LTAAYTRIRARHGPVSNGNEQMSAIPLFPHSPAMQAGGRVARSQTAQFGSSPTQAVKADLLTLSASKSVLLFT